MSTVPAKSMSRNLRDTDLVVAISTDDSFLHINPLAELLGHMRQHVEEESGTHAVHEGHDGHVGDTRVLEFFDAGGRPLHPQLNPDLQLVGFFTDPEVQVATDELLTRISRALDGAQAKLDADPDLGKQQGLPPATDVPRPNGSLEEVLANLAAAFDMHPGAGHRAGWFHNLFHV